MKPRRSTVWWVNPDSGKWEIYQSGLPRARAERLAGNVTYVMSPRWFGRNVPTRVVDDGFGYDGVKNPVDERTGTIVLFGLGAGVLVGIGALLGRWMASKPSTSSADEKYARAIAYLSDRAAVDPGGLVPVGGAPQYVLWLAIREPEARLLRWKPIDRGSLEALRERARAGLADISPPMTYCVRPLGDPEPSGYPTGAQCAVLG